MERKSTMKSMLEKLLLKYEKHFSSGEGGNDFSPEIDNSMTAGYEKISQSSLDKELLAEYWETLTTASTDYEFLHSVRLLLCLFNEDPDLQRMNFREPYLYTGLTAMSLNAGAFFRKKRAEVMMEKKTPGLASCCKSNEKQRCCRAYQANEPVIPAGTKLNDPPDNWPDGWDDQLLLAAETFEPQLLEMGFPKDGYHEVKLFSL